jgi:phytoene dehydrogenase-like protein
VEKYDVIIVGGGIGGLVAGGLLARSGARVLLLEQGVHVGGCAATFSHRGYRFDAGATIGCGFHRGGPMHWLAEQLHISWPLRPLPVAWEYCDGDLSLALDPARSSLLQRFPESLGFWREQGELADGLWDLSECLLALYGQGRMRQAASLGACLLPRIKDVQLLRLASMSVAQWLKGHGLADNKLFCRFIDAQLLISAQTARAADCNALFAVLALDLPRRSPCVFDGGMGTVAELIGQAIGTYGGQVRLGEKVQSLTRQGERIREVVTEKGSYLAKEVVVNGSSATLALLLGKQPTSAGGGKVSDRTAWGAFILHLGVENSTMGERPGDHLQLLRPESIGLAEGNSLFLSASPSSDPTRAPSGKRALTLSTHTRVDPWWQAWRQGKEAYQSLKAEYTEAALNVAAGYIPGMRQGMDFCLAGSPVTYARYTGRHLGLVGGYTQTRLRAPEQNLFGLKNCTLVGDNSFPGQSMAGVTVGATMAVDGLRRRL